MREVNFSRVVIEVQSAYGMTDRELAEHCKVQPNTIKAIREGKTQQPGYALGAKLVAMWEAR